MIGPTLQDGVSRARHIVAYPWDASTSPSHWPRNANNAAPAPRAPISVGASAAGRMADCQDHLRTELIVAGWDYRLRGPAVREGAAAHR